MIDIILTVLYSIFIILIQEAVQLDNKEISQAVIGRLPRYFRFLGELKDEGIERLKANSQ